MYSLNVPEDSSCSSIVSEIRSFKNNSGIPAEYRKWYIIGNDNQGEELLAINSRGELWLLHKMGIIGAEKIADNFEEGVNFLMAEETVKDQVLAV